MTDLPPIDQEQLIQRIRRDLADSWDEEIEMDMEDYHPLPGLPDGGANDAAEKDYRRSERGSERIVKESPPSNIIYFPQPVAG